MAKNPIYPIYIISKGRSDSQLTARSLANMGVPYRVVVEPQEYEEYLKNPYVTKENCIVTPFSNLGQGSIPVRNFVWDHSIQEGHERHWIMDDNIRWFFRYDGVAKIRVTNGTILRLAEEFSDRFENVKQFGLNYTFFCPVSEKKPPYLLNTRIYSCICNSNDIEHRWRGKYNEDTDLSIRILKDGWCTILYNAFVCGKEQSMVMKGGNTEEVYQKGQEGFDNRYRFAKSLYDQHPDIVHITKKWGRYHHHVDYTIFNQKLKFKLGVKEQIPKQVNEHGMKLKKISKKDENKT